MKTTLKSEEQWDEAEWKERSTAWYTGKSITGIRLDNTLGDLLSLHTHREETKVCVLLDRQKAEWLLAQLIEWREHQRRN